MFWATYRQDVDLELVFVLLWLETLKGLDKCWVALGQECTLYSEQMTFHKKIECKEWSRTPPPSTNKKGGKIEKGAPGRSGARRAWEGNQTGTLTRWTGLMGGKAPVGRSTCVKKLVLWLIVFFFRSVCLSVVGFSLHEWRILVHTLVTWVLTGSAENVGRWNEPGNRQSHVF